MYEVTVGVDRTEVYVEFVGDAVAVALQNAAEIGGTIAHPDWEGSYISFWPEGAVGKYFPECGDWGYGGVLPEDAELILGRLNAALRQE